MTQSSAPLPTLFVSHGSPMHALEAGATATGRAWTALGERLPRPRAILIASAHWETDRPALTGSECPETIHDFRGFPQPLYEIRYAAPGSPAIAGDAAGLLRAAGFDVRIDADRGLDHGAWTPLLYAYPRADIPVVQLAVQPALGTRHHLALGMALAPLAAQGVLIAGSGHLTHNLRELASVREIGVSPAAPYVSEFQAWVLACIDAHDHERLADYRQLSPAGVRAHPTDEHFLPLFVALGAAPAGYRSERFIDHVEGGVLAMDAYLLHAPG
jgi:4,5-DOPA dioxygenase extradiol